MSLPEGADVYLFVALLEQAGVRLDRIAALSSGPHLLQAVAA